MRLRHKSHTTGRSAPLVLHHHERWDGQGYPAGLKENEIPLGARILGLVQHYDALTSGSWGDVILPEPGSAPPEFSEDRQISSEAAIEALRQDAGKAFDPELVEQFTHLIRNDPPALVRTIAEEIHRIWAETSFKDVYQRKDEILRKLQDLRWRVLVVDDDASTLDLLAKTLVEAGCEVHTPADATTALSSIRTAEYDLLILGFPYREVDGLSLIRQVQRIRAELPVVIIIGSSTGETASSIEVLNLGVAGFLRKPFGVPEVLAAAAKALGTRAGTRTT